MQKKNVFVLTYRLFLSLFLSLTFTANIHVAAQSSINNNNTVTSVKDTVADDHALDEITVVARKNMETERMLMLERRNASISTESIGAREMSLKGLSTVADGVKKITGISMEGNSRVFVRGLGDRYSMTSLNGFPIASPNPDNKLIPLTLFPTSIVKNISVSKVYDVSVFGDYSGAHIDIETKENIGSDYISIALSAGSKTNTFLTDFYSSDKTGASLPYFGISKGLNLPDKLKNMRTDDFIDYQRTNAPFSTSFNIEKNTAMPAWGAEIGIGRSWVVGKQKLNILYAVNFNNDYNIYKDAYTSTVNAQGVVRDQFHYNKYLYETTATMLGQINYTCRTQDILSYNIMYVNNTEDSYTERKGFDAEGIDLQGSNSLYHIYTLFNHQLAGKHKFLGNRLSTDWQLSYGKTGSDEPDRRQVMFSRNSNGDLSLFKLNQQETMRYFGQLFEDERNGDVKIKYQLGKAGKFLGNPAGFIRLGLSLRNKTRDFYAANFYYNLKNITPSIKNIYDTDDYLRQENISSGDITIHKNSQPRNKYLAASDIYASFIDAECYPLENLLLSAGVRYEYANQWVKYWTDAAEQKTETLSVNDFFPSLSIKYMPEKNQNLRFTVSRTITRPSFIEMAPFEYKESYGSATTRGNANIRNGYNYNIDLRYEIFHGQNDLFSLGFYYKHLETPIEKVQQYAGSQIQTFLNADRGTAAGAEIEFRKQLTGNFRIDCNASYIYTHISLPRGGLYTEASRALQGASPYLVNIDLNYMPAFGREKKITFTTTYNLQGPRISAVGINGVNNIIEEAFNTLDFITSYNLNPLMKIKFQAKNLINQQQKYTQKTGDTDEIQTVAYLQKNLSLSLGFQWIF